MRVSPNAQRRWVDYKRGSTVILLDEGIENYTRSTIMARPLLE